MASRPAPSQSEAERAFADAMADAGFTPGPIKSDTSGFVRFDAPGDKKGKGNGFYKIKLGQYPVGWFGDWKGGEQHQWFFHNPNTGELSAKERAAIKREQATLKAEAAQAREAKQAEVAENASRMWSEADTNVEGHPYLERKRIKVPRGLRIHTDAGGARLLTVPMWAFDMAGEPKLTGLQRIFASGDKRFLTAQRVEGTFFSLKGESSAVLICEGVATAFKLWEATGLSVVAAFNSGNLIPVAKDFARYRPLATILIAGDDDVIAPDDWDQRGKGKPWVNAGRQKAKAAATAIGARMLLPTFADGPARDRTDFDDLWRIEGEEVVRAQVFGTLRHVAPEDSAPGAEIVEPDFIQDETWRTNLPETAQGALDGGNVRGVELYIANHKLLRHRLAYNGFSRAIEIDGNDMEDHHVAEFRRIMHTEFFKARKADVADEMIAAARQAAFDPLTKYLSGLEWDGKQRLDGWMTTYLGVARSEYSVAVGRAALVGSVARALRPGCKLDTMVIVEGEQGTGKSTAIRFLYGDRFFTDNLPDFHSKDSFQQLSGAWCVEVAELNKMSNADVGDVKQFLSRVEDKYRPPYERLPIKAKRRTVLWGTVNPEAGQGYLKDQTGNRRFYPVASTCIDTDAILRDRDQLWAEAVFALGEGEEWHLTGDAATKAVEEQEKRRENHPWESVLRSWILETSCQEATVEKVLAQAIKLPAERWDPRASRLVGQAFRALGWQSTTAWMDGKPAKVFQSPERRSARRLDEATPPRQDPFAERDPGDF